MNLRPHIVIDLGSVNITGASDNRIVSLPSQIIRNTKTGETVSVGRKAIQQPEVTLPQKRIFAARSGRLVDYEAAQQLIRKVIRQLLSWWTLFRPLALVATSLQSTAAENRQLKEAAQISGANSVFTTESIVLSAFGAGISPTNSEGSLILDIGGGKSESAVIVRGSTVATNTTGIGGGQLTRDIVRHIDDAYGYTLSFQQANNLLREIGTAIPQDNPATTNVIDQETGEKVTISANDTATAVRASLREVADCVHAMMQQTSAALLTDISRSGVTITGGVGNLDHIDIFFSRQLSVPVVVADNPHRTVAAGGRIAWSRLRKHPQYPQVVQLG